MLFEKQKFQEDCVANIIKVLNDTDIHNNDYSNLKNAVKQLNDDEKQTQFITVDSAKIDILMETGTGKTFTYLKTIFEINKEYGKNRFIIVVPRNAIKLGIIQNIKLTKEYFYNEYKKHLNIIEYPKDGLSKIENDFLHNDNRISVLVLTNSAFNKDKNLINQMPENGTLFINGTVWDNIAKKNPIVIIDEPHLLKGKETQSSFEKINSLFIRFGATYPHETTLSDDIKLSNVTYALDSITAFNQYLVKKISVNTVLSNSETGEYILSSIEAKKKQFKLSYFRNNEPYAVDLSLKQDIGIKTGIESFNGVHAVKITANTVYLSNTQELHLDNNFSLSDEETRILINQTIKKHFEKEETLFQKDIKTLSLFFIPSISGFRGDNPIIKIIFEKEYKKIRNEIYAKTTNEAYKAYLDKDYNDRGELCVHEGYFSGDKGTKDAQESEGINLILSDKEKLLSTETSLRFIFSVWALQEGWDNPNVFNICKIANTAQDISRRQQIGRGLRIAVNKQGKRLTYNYMDESEEDFYSINTLDVFVSHYELDFIGKIQQEIEEASFCIVGNTVDAQMLEDKGLNKREASRLLNILEDENIIEYSEETDTFNIKSSIYEFISQNPDTLTFLKPDRLAEVKSIFKEVNSPVTNGNKPKMTVQIRQDKFKEFKALWETINRKSKLVYQDIEQDTLIKTIAEKFNKENIPPIQIKVKKQSFDSHNNQIKNDKEEIISDKVEFFKTTHYSDFIHSFIRDEKLKLPLQFVSKLLSETDMEKIKNNPKKAKSCLRDIIIDHIHDSLTQKIDYEFESEIKVTSLQDSKGKYLKEIPYTKLGRRISDKPAGDNLLYDKIIFDSQIEEDIQINDPPAIGQDKITVFAKLPKISIPTPYKSYNPDFAYLIDRPQGKKLFLIVESKGYNSESDIPKEEQQKIKYAKVFFEKLQSELPDIDVSYQTRINKQELSELLSGISTGQAQNERF